MLQSLGMHINFKNPFYFKTKAEMVRECLDLDILKKTFSESASCGKRRPQPKWDVKGAKQCGTCMPCIYRRAALHQLNLDNEIYGKDLLKKTDPLNASADMPALFDYLKAPLPIAEIKRNLLVNGSIPLDKLTGYARVVKQSRAEIVEWIKDRGNQAIKDELGIK